jgi:hypothetical protein
MPDVCHTSTAAARWARSAATALSSNARYAQPNDAADRAERRVQGHEAQRSEGEQLCDGQRGDEAAR